MFRISLDPRLDALSQVLFGNEWHDQIGVEEDPQASGDVIDTVKICVDVTLCSMKRFSLVEIYLFGQHLTSLVLNPLRLRLNNFFSLL